MKRTDVATDRAVFIGAAPQTCRGMLTKAFAGKASPRAAIKAKCLDCCHWDREEIANCLVILCPLHAYRPFQARKAAGAAPVSEPAT